MIVGDDAPVVLRQCGGVVGSYEDIAARCCLRQDPVKSGVRQHD